jgi:hypothetical protein
MQTPAKFVQVVSECAVKCLGPQHNITALHCKLVVCCSVFSVIHGAQPDGSEVQPGPFCLMKPVITCSMSGHAVLL